MTWSYSFADLSTSAKDQLRLMIGDTVAASPQFQDEELAYFLSQRSSIFGTAALCCQTLSSQYSRSADTAAGNTSIKYSQMAAAYSRRAAMFENKDAALGGAAPYAGGTSNADKINNEQNSDRVGPQFTIDMDDNYLPVASPSGGSTTDSNPLTSG